MWIGVKRFCCVQKSFYQPNPHWSLALTIFLSPIFQWPLSLQSEQYGIDIPFVAKHASDVYSLYLDELQVSVLTTHHSVYKETALMKSQNWTNLWVNMNLEGNLVLYQLSRITVVGGPCELPNHGFLFTVPEMKSNQRAVGYHHSNCATVKVVSICCHAGH